MTTTVLQPGSAFPEVNVAKVGGGTINLAKPEGGHDWKLVVVYRGKHCPLCTQYLQELNQMLPEFNAAGVDVVALSADSLANAEAQLAQVNPLYAVGYDLTIDQMKELGLHVSSPRLGMGAERPFAEPGLFVINEKGNLQVVDMSNVPVARPPLGSILMGVKFLRNLTEEYPVGGSYA